MGVKRHHDFMWRFSKQLIFGFRRPVFIYLLSLAFSLMALFSVGIYFAESPVNPGIREPFDAVYYVVTVMSGVGLGDLVPVTRTGRVLSMMMMLIGTALFVSFTAVLSIFLWEVEWEK